MSRHQFSVIMYLKAMKIYFGKKSKNKRNLISRLIRNVKFKIIRKKTIRKLDF